MESNELNLTEEASTKRNKPTKEERLSELRALMEKEVERHNEKMAYYEKMIATWEAKGDKMAGVEFQEGNVVAFMYGRPGHVQVEKQGLVMGFKDMIKGGIFAVVECGEGVDKEILRIRPSQVTAVLS